MSGRQIARKLLVQIPAVRRYLDHKRSIYQDLIGLQAAHADLALERDRLAESYEAIARERDSPGDAREPRHDAAEELIRIIKSGESLSSATAHQTADDVEALLQNPAADRTGVHLEIGKAIFARSADLYTGKDLPFYLVRYTYPPFISIALSSHCNAACFFCRSADYKGTSIEFPNIKKLESAIRNARVIDLTGWGEPFFYPKFEEVVSYILSVNTDTPQLIQITSNGSFLSTKWGKLLSGKLHRLIISINAATSETYKEQMLYKNQKFTFDSTIACIKEFQQELTPEDRGRLFLSMVANTGNFREITQLVRTAHELDIKTVSVGHFICADPAHIDKVVWHVKDEYNAEITRARALGAEFGIGLWGRTFGLDEKDKKGADTCMAPFEQFFIEMPGTTTPCCFMGRERMGNAYEDGFEAVWFSDIMNRLRADRYLPPCKVCTIFGPFDNKSTHISAMLLTTEEETTTVGGPKSDRKLEASELN